MGYINDFIKTPFFDFRYNSDKAYMSNKPLGCQVLIDFLGSYIWINIKKEQICLIY